MPSYTFQPNVALPSAVMNRLGMDPVQADIAAEQATTSTSYTNLSTVGPTVTLSLTAGQKVLVVVSAEVWGADAGVEFGYMSFAVSGATTATAVDTNAASNRITSNVIAMVSRSTIITAAATGSTAFTAQYRSTVGTATANFRDRRIIVFPKL